jgi:SAM-dependent methyltransferase
MPQPLQPLTRRNLLRTAAVGCGCFSCGSAPSAHALAALKPPPEELVRAYDGERDQRKDAGFARGMATGMKDYERAVAPTKRRLFGRLLGALPARAEPPVVVELGMGSFPNAPYYAAANTPLDVVGVDPNDAMGAYARRAAAPLLAAGSSVRVVHGVGEALPLADASVDAVVCTLTLCSVPSPERTLAEVRRVLRPGGRLLFLEHVLSETDARLAAAQALLDPMQVAAADGCHLNRRTLETIRAAGFASVDAEYFELDGFLYLDPTVAGIATA